MNKRSCNVWVSQLGLGKVNVSEHNLVCFPYFDSMFSKFQCGFQKGFNAQHCLLTMVEKWRKTLNEGGETGAVLTDLSKAFDCIDHNLFIAKLNAYGFEKRSLEFIHSYLTKRKQRTKVDSAFSSWEMLLSGFPKGQS